MDEELIPIQDLTVGRIVFHEKQWLPVLNITVEEPIPTDKLNWKYWVTFDTNGEWEALWRYCYGKQVQCRIVDSDSENAGR